MQKKIHTFAKKQWKQGREFFLFSVLRVTAQGLFAVLPLVFAFFLSPEGFGAFSLGMMVIYLFISLLVTSSHFPFVVYAGEERKKRKKISQTFTSRLVLLMASTVIFLLVVLLFQDSLAEFTSLTKPEYFFLVLAYFGMGLRFYFENLFLGLNMRRHHALYEVLTAFFAVLYLGYLYFFSVIDLTHIFLMLFIAPLLSFLCMSWTIDYSLLLPLEFKRKNFVKLLRYTVWVGFGGIAVYVVNWGDNFVLRQFVSLEEIGVYNLGYQILKGLIILTSTINLYFLPFITQNLENKRKMRDYLYSKRPRILSLGVVAIIAAYFVIPPFIEFIYGQTYQGAIAIGQILLLGGLFALYRDFYQPLFSALKKYKFATGVIIAAGILNLLLDFLFVPLMGIMGAAIATVAAFFLIASSYEIYFRLYCRKTVI